ncbi:hypothetical protein [Chryseobacterium sp. Marseille-Q3244]|uniref:hypothetical protein n=1 Tax=Chryseobacterium sp. Marseille-Q3244 TaxID=2758092 RepID=UPI002024F16E|nr:hypothetical protein [Chryseobacterium sp. Marseille-Q3244]
MNKKHIVVVGLGGVGGYFGFKINQINETSGKYTVSFVALKLIHLLCAKVQIKR